VEWINRCQSERLHAAKTVSGVERFPAQWSARDLYDSELLG